MTSPVLSDLTLSRLIVGTVQFGLRYGIANRVGQPSFEQVCQILQCAIENGATTLDTAAIYGESEAVLGRALDEIGARDKVTVVTKLCPVKKMTAAPTPANIDVWLRESVERSLKNLRLEVLPLVLFHDTSDIPHMETLLKLKDKGWVRHTGVSVTRPDQMPDVLAAPGVEAIQIAASMLDQRILRNGDLAHAAQRKMAIFVRSVYLQGLLLMPEKDILPALQEVIPVRRTLERIAAEAGLSMAEMALRYGLSLPGITGVLTGVETVDQMRENLALAARGPLPAGMMEAIHSAVPTLSDTILFPWHWPNAMR